ncbi:MAG: discoidin domain-containing protein, partial [Planctomycetaceae bacterium]|nr:discoidin domain-containing protein [Planctomycetaceae bacterium]
MSRMLLLMSLFAAGNLSAAENIAPKAKVSATSEYDGNYSARFALDGIVPNALSQQDVKTAWVVNGALSRQNGGATFRLEWDTPQSVAEVVYFGRTAMILDECFKDYEIFINDNETAVAKGTLLKKHGAQRITLSEPKTTQSLTIKFLNSYTSRYNPGASEIAVYSEIPGDKELAQFTGEKRTHAEEALAASVSSGDFGFTGILAVERQ